MQLKSLRVHSRSPLRSISAHHFMDIEPKSHAHPFLQGYPCHSTLSNFFAKKFYGTAQNRLTPILPTLSLTKRTCNFTKIQKVCHLCRYWLKQQNTPYGKESCYKVYSNNFTFSVKLNGGVDV